MKKEEYIVAVDVTMYREICAEYNRRKRLRRVRKMVSKLLWFVSIIMLLITSALIISLLYLNYTDIEGIIMFLVFCGGCGCGILASNIDPEN